MGLFWYIFRLFWVLEGVVLVDFALDPILVVFRLCLGLFGCAFAPPALVWRGALGSDLLSGSL